MKIQYEIDGQGGLTGKSRLVDDDVVETIIFKNAWDNDGYLNHSYDVLSNKWIGNNDGLEQVEPTPTAPTEVDQLKLMVGNLVSENAKKDQSIKQLQTMTGSLVAQIAELNKGGN